MNDETASVTSPAASPAAGADGASSQRVSADRSEGGRIPLDLQIAALQAAARIVSGPQSSHLIQDPDIAQSVAASFRTVYDAILGAVSGGPVPNGDSRAGL